MTATAAGPDAPAEPNPDGAADLKRSASGAAESRVAAPGEERAAAAATTAAAEERGELPTHGNRSAAGATGCASAGAAGAAASAEAAPTTAAIVEGAFVRARATAEGAAPVPELHPSTAGSSAESPRPRLTPGRGDVEHTLDANLVRGHDHERAIAERTKAGSLADPQGGDRDDAELGGIRLGDDGR